MNLRIGLFGKMASGKSLVAQHLVDEYGFVELAFAARLKQICSEMFGFDVAKKDERGRLILQQFAQHMREIDASVWVRYIMQQIPPQGNVVISDMRFPNEYWQLTQMGFATVRMIMDRETQERMVAKSYPGLPLVLLDDYSETALDDKPFDYSINNSTGYSLDNVYAQVDDMVGRLRVKMANTPRAVGYD